MAFEGLPEELMSLILVKLPVKSLLRCKCVRKSWYSLIKSPQFIRLHHRSSSSSSPKFIISRHVREEEKEPRNVLSFHSKETLADLGNAIDTRALWANELGSDVSLSGSCDGLVCIHNHYDTDYFFDDETDQIIICNPETQEFRSLFVPSISDFDIESVAFGSDPSTGQFKVVMIGVPSNLCDRELKVYDFSTDSWRDTAIVIPAPFSYSHRAISFNGVFHWCPDYSDILTFHIRDEVAGSIAMPDFFRPSPGKQLYVSSESQQLSLVIYDWEGQYEICVMTEYGVKES